MKHFGIALGSNEGDRPGHLRAAVRWMDALAPDCLLVSRVYETAPVDCVPGTPSFLNAVCEISAAMAPIEMLRLLREFERVRGRKESYLKNSPRPLDLDLLYADQIVVNTPELMLPHPRMLQRRFVLQPLCDIRPELVLPGRESTIREILALLPPDQGVRLHPESAR